jgi:hypothetical protein
MPKFEPQFEVKPLSQVSPGALVIFQHAIAFAAINRSAPAMQQAVTLAAHDVANNRFTYRYFDSVQPNVLVPGGGEVVIRPKLDSLTADVSVQPASTQLFYKDAPYLVVQLLAGNDFRLLNLTDGSLVTSRVSHMDAFTSWEAGVMSLGEFLPLLKI